MYKVISYFEDRLDNLHPYNIGDVFPRPGQTADKIRIAELSGSNNMQRKPLIARIEEAAEETAADAEPKPSKGKRGKKAAEK